MASAGVSEPSDLYENVTISRRLSRSNCIKKPNVRRPSWRSSYDPTRSQSIGDLPSQTAEEEGQLGAYSEGEGFDSSFESLYDDDDLDEGLKPEDGEAHQDCPVGPIMPLSRLWSHVPKVIASGILDKLSPGQRHTQEAKYEILTTEQEFNKNLHILEDLFINGVQFVDASIMTKIARENVFKNMKAITDSSDKFLNDLYVIWERNILLTEIFDVLFKHASPNFETYVRYCTKKMDMEDVLKAIQKYFDKIRNEPAFCRQTLDSFFLSPMQRITRFPLLVSSIFKQMDKTDEEYQACEKALIALEKVASKCNENVRHKELMETTIALISKIEFPRSVPSIALISKKRWLVKHDEFTLHWSTTKKTSTLKPFMKKQVSLILFNDLILVCRKKNDQFFVEGYCKTNLTRIDKTDKGPYIPSKYKHDKDGRFWVSLSFLNNHEKKTQDMILSCESDNKRSEWIKAFEPPISDILGEIIYHFWDCPLFLVIKNYSSTKPGHLNINIADKIHVLKKTTYGFYEGQREGDEQKGLFPKECVTEIDSDHKKARDLRMKLNRMSVAF